MLVIKWSAEIVSQIRSFQTDTNKARRIDKSNALMSWRVKEIVRIFVQRLTDCSQHDGLNRTPEAEVVSSQHEGKSSQRSYIILLNSSHGENINTDGGNR